MALVGPVSLTASQPQALGGLGSAHSVTHLPLLQTSIWSSTEQFSPLVLLLLLLFVLGVMHWLLWHVCVLGQAQS